MRKIIFLSFSFVLAGFYTVAQRDLTPKSRKAAFGKNDTRILNNYGLQVTFGPTYQFTRSVNKTHSVETLPNGNRYQYTHDPQGKLGFFIDLGTAHIPTRDSRFGLKKRIVSLYDWGIGFKYLGGSERTIIDYTDAVGNTVSTATGEGNFYNGYAYGRFTAYHFDYLTKSIFISNGLGVNVDYRLMENGGEYSEPMLPSTQHFHKNLVGQIHYDFGVGFKLKRGSYLIPGFQLPVVGVYEWNNFNPALKWYSSNYWPVLFKVKFIYLFEKSAKGCPPVGTSDADKQREKEFRQGN